MKHCDIHDIDMTERESKTKVDEDGNPKTYWAHDLEKGYCFGKPQSGETKTWARPDRAAPREESPDWDAISRGKIRSLFIEAHISKNGIVRLNEAELIVLDELVNIAMGK